MAAKKQKIRRPKAIQPRGFRDYFGAEVAERNAMLAKITDVYRRYGFDPLETSAVETVEALGKFLPDVDRPNEGVFAWQDEDETWLALRYDLTAPLARVYAQYRNDLPTPYRRFAVGPVWRNEKPGPGRFRQFYQCDADTVGSASVAADAEICAMLIDTLEAVGHRARRLHRADQQPQGAERGDGNCRPEKAFWTPPTQRPGRTSAASMLLRHRQARQGRAWTACAHFSARGARMRAAPSPTARDFPKTQADRVLGFMAARGADAAQTVANLRSVVEGSGLGTEGVSELEQIANLISAQGYGPDQFVIDPSVVRGLGYYTGPVYEAELTFEILDDKGRKRQFGSVAGGGRYDDLVKRFTGQEVPATGVSIGVDRLLAALREKGRGAAEAEGPVIVTVMDRDRMADYQQMVKELREAGLRAEVYLGNPKNFGNQLKYADARQSPVAVIEGSDEKARGVVQIKDLALGAQLAADITTNEEWKAQPAQMEVPRAELAAQVRAMIARAG